MAAREFVVYGMQVVRYCSGRHGGLPLRLTAMHTSLYTFILFIPFMNLNLRKPESPHLITTKMHHMRVNVG